jgi:hypothetical protein
VIDLDIDTRTGIDGRKQLWQILKAHDLSLPQTAIAKSGSGGLHFYFRNSKRIILHGKKDFFPGVDIRAEGAHVVAPPSIHTNGNSYEWILKSIDEIADANEDVSLMKCCFATLRNALLHKFAKRINFIVALPQLHICQKANASL